MEINQKVADFTLQTDEDKTVSLSDYKGCLLYTSRCV